MDKVESARNLVKQGAAVSRALRMSEEVDDKFTYAHPLYEETAKTLVDATTRLSNALDQHEAILEEQEQHVA